METMNKNENKNIKKILAATGIYLGSYALSVIISGAIGSHFDKILQEDKDDIETAEEIRKDVYSMEELEDMCKNDLEQLEKEYNKDCKKYKIIVSILSFIIGFTNGFIATKIAKKILEK